MIEVNQPTNRYIIEPLGTGRAQMHFCLGILMVSCNKRVVLAIMFLKTLPKKLIQENPVLLDSLKDAVKSSSTFTEQSLHAVKCIVQTVHLYFEKSYMIYPVYRIMQ